ncbi:hypothetical protein [Halorussus marinus]|uniref:hypothetical protein n=1 Tax=Halorussus marinus TaxID=2505976 RepID=UPI00142F94CC|nr:hypothetical protein [Halorussus marinus]
MERTEAESAPIRIPAGPRMSIANRTLGERAIAVVRTDEGHGGALDADGHGERER